MAVITIRNIDESVKSRLRIQAARHGHSMEEEARQILARGLPGDAQAPGLGTRLAQRFAALGGVDLPLPARAAPRPAPDFGDTAANAGRKTPSRKPRAPR